MRCASLLLFVATAWLAFAPHSISAATVTMRDGRHLVGDILAPSKSDHLDLLVSSGTMQMTLHLKRSDILRIDQRQSPEERQRAETTAAADAAFAAKDAAELWNQVERFDTDGDRDLATAEARRVIILDPHHEQARQRLGHRQHEGEWMTVGEWAEATGMVRHGGRWMTPAAAEEARAAEAEAEALRLAARAEREAERDARRAERQRQARASAYGPPRINLISGSIAPRPWVLLGSHCSGYGVRSVPYAYPRSGGSLSWQRTTGSSGFRINLNW